MTGRPEMTDSAIVSMLTARSDRAARYRFDLHAIVASAGPQARRFSPSSRFIGRISLAATGLAAVMVIAALVGSSLLEKPGTSHGPIGSESTISSSGSFSPTASPSTTPPTEAIRILSAAEAGQLIRSQSVAHAGSLLVVNGRLIPGETVVTQCASGPCGSVLLADAGGGFVVRPIGDFGPGPSNPSVLLAGTFVLRLSATVSNDLRIVDFVGVLTTPPNGGPAWFVQDLLDGAAHVDGAYAAVDGWLVRDPDHPCASDPRNPVVAYGCPSDDWLSEDRFQPLQENGQSIGPPAAIDLSTGSYDRWAPDPAPAGFGGRGVEPRHAIYLLRLVSDGCRPGAYCLAPAPRWRIVGRFDPLPDPLQPAPSPSTEPPSTDVVHTVAQLVADPFAFTNRDITVSGWLVATPLLRCLEHPVPSGEPDYGCDEVDWLTDDAFQPWVSNGSSGGTREPAVGIRVQNGAYAAFAPSPAFGEIGARVPWLGDWVLRASIGSTCPDASQPPQLMCAGGPIIHWEVIARLP